jgi:endonuclease YncB( thermonuclease family)
MRKLALFAMLPLLSGCVVGTVAKTAFDVATVPVKVASAGVDAVTTSQAEADQKRGREARQMADRCKQERALPTDICSAAQPY